ncbi:unnamed protein product [Protopolystoma xenopodis]|uniref:Uncharacterized protein n=1 Tax=Protopolystoma xenopodis TaxID=117903 RepID=A0A448WS48_9PLAT|nr:unnamed protein product [Protopolystoma xenopodis]
MEPATSRFKRAARTRPICCQASVNWAMRVVLWSRQLSRCVVNMRKRRGRAASGLWTRLEGGDNLDAEMEGVGGYSRGMRSMQRTGPPDPYCEMPGSDRVIVPLDLAPVKELSFKKAPSSFNRT